MSKSSSAFKVVRSAIGSFKIEADEWKWDHDAAMKCYEFEDFLLVGIALFDAITQFDERHRARVLSGEIEFDPDHSELVREAYKWWLEPSGSIAAHIAKLRAQYGEVKNAEKFLSLCREAKGILTDDAAFFSGDALVALRDEAIDEHRAGKTSECGTRE